MSHIWSTAMSDSGQLMESYVENLWCAVPYPPSPLLMVGFVKSKEKFLSAVSSDGFGFCSVILYVISCLNYRVFTSDPAAGTCTMPCIRENFSSQTRQMVIVTLLRPSICPRTAGSPGRTTFHFSWSPSWIPKQRLPLASAHVAC